MRKLKFEGGVESKLAESEILDTARSLGPPPLSGVETLQHRYLILGTAGSSRAWLDSEQVLWGFPFYYPLTPKVLFLHQLTWKSLAVSTVSPAQGSAQKLQGRKEC